MNDQSQAQHFQRKRVTSPDELPYMLNASDVASFIGISQSGAYELMKQEGFPSFTVGKRRFVCKTNLLAWIDKKMTSAS